MIPYENLSDIELIAHIEQTEKLDRADVNELIKRYDAREDQYLIALDEEAIKNSDG